MTPQAVNAVLKPEIGFDLRKDSVLTVRLILPAANVLAPLSRHHAITLSRYHAITLSRYHAITPSRHRSTADLRFITQSLVGNQVVEDVVGDGIAQRSDFTFETCRTQLVDVGLGEILILVAQ
jgi:hypothetical protein